jgi:hypothetical protein
MFRISRKTIAALFVLALTAMTQIAPVFAGDPSQWGK